MKIGILGHFGEGLTLLNGQTVKTKNLVEGLTTYTDIEVIKIDSHGWTRKPFSLLKSIKSAFLECDSIIMLPAHKGVRVFAPLLVFFRRKYKKKIFYDVIGGWLPDVLARKKSLSERLKSFDGIWVETSTMHQKMRSLGFSNVSVVPNFKELNILSENEFVYSTDTPYPLCTFSRVMKEKGIGTAVEVVKSVNEKLGYTAYCLDIYGQVDSGQIDWFDELKKDFPEYVRYCGCVDSKKSVEILKNYFALLFPTHFYTEGIPGTVIDAYAAGVPVISAKWESYADVVDEKKTGIGYTFDDVDMFGDILLSAAAYPDGLNIMKKECLKRARSYTTVHGIDVVLKCIEKDE